MWTADCYIFGSWIYHSLSVLGFITEGASNGRANRYAGGYPELPGRRGHPARSSRRSLWSTWSCRDRRDHRPSDHHHAGNIYAEHLYHRRTGSHRHIQGAAELLQSLSLDLPAEPGTTQYLKRHLRRRQLASAAHRHPRLPRSTGPRDSGPPRCHHGHADRPGDAVLALRLARLRRSQRLASRHRRWRSNNGRREGGRCA